MPIFQYIFGHAAKVLPVARKAMVRVPWLYGRVQSLVFVAIAVAGTVAMAAATMPFFEGMRAFVETYGPYDAFGVKRLYASDASGQSWDSRSWHESARALSSPQVDPLDPYFRVRGSDNLLVIRGDGTAESSGSQVRYYIADPQGHREWKNFEFTMYSMRVGEASPPSYAGFAVQGRTGPGHTDRTGVNADGHPVQCDGSAYTAAVRYDGGADFKKEIKWPNYTKENPETVLYADGLPRNQWIGMKYIVYNVNDDQDVKMELWIDETDGRNGGHWIKVIEYVDKGGWAIPSTEEASSCKYSTDEKLLEGGPALIVRNDGVHKQLYKNMSIREITVTPAMNIAKSASLQLG
jgi:hypothetical protein